MMENFDCLHQATVFTVLVSLYLWKFRGMYSHLMCQNLLFSNTSLDRSKVLSCSSNEQHGKKTLAHFQFP